MAAITELACTRIEVDIFSRETARSIVKPARETYGLLVCSLTWAINPGHVAMAAYVCGVIAFCKEVIPGINPRVTCLAGQIASIEHNAFVQ